MSFPILPGFVLLTGGIRLLCFALSVLHIKGQINLFCIIAHNFFFFFFKYRSELELEPPLFLLLRLHNTATHTSTHGVGRYKRMIHFDELCQ